MCSQSRLSNSHKVGFFIKKILKNHKINQKSSVNIRDFLLYVKHLNNQDMFNRLGFLIFIYKNLQINIDICNSMFYKILIISRITEVLECSIQRPQLRDCPNKMCL